MVTFIVYLRIPRTNIGHLVLRQLLDTPVESEVFAQIVEEIVCQDDLSMFNMHHCYPPFLAGATISISELQIPMGSYHIVADEIKDIPDADVLNFEIDFWKLLEEMSEPTFYC